MRILTAAIILATSASTIAFAAEARLPDADYIQASHCRGLMGDSEAGAKLEAALKDNTVGRADFIVSRATRERGKGQRALREATKSGDLSSVQRVLASDCAAFKS
ncbi:MAG: hypothetical protein Q8L66_15265 [Caulobacter sp.]|nr:hypothetical protein [Caulobacter sp.]